MKFGMVLISNAYSPARGTIAKWSFDSLSKTDVEGLSRPRMALMVKPSRFDYKHYTDMWSKKWDVEMVPDAGAKLNILVLTTANVLIRHEDVTHLVFMYDDFLFNSQWMHQLENLIWRHPNAIAWSVYRSSYNRHHKIVSIEENTGDTVMTCHDGLGCLTVAEWRAYGVGPQTDFSCTMHVGGGNTIDLHHADTRRGERWATGKDYWQNLGVHPWLGRRDMALEFIGEK